MNVASTHWKRERVHAEEECWQAEREQALRDIILLMRRYDISMNELEPLLQDGGEPVPSLFVD
ncbi:hypothetical protein [Caenibius tardaugens]|uniref:hypothetical protein n=1 Tax=Caenibius tardaugens TaxID=169176 RepID=UPI000F6040D4|nr:hypothetical protein [Caenibius tardaugens]AZI36353.1 hypothetical protein EGO55_10645 [Caenibius tardaugens NBRC 16725]